MQAVFKFELDNTDIQKITKYCNSVEYCAIEQSVGWIEMFYKTRICYFLLFENDEIVSFSQISENFRFAHISFGPVCCDKELMILSINEIINYYKNRRFFYLGIQMYYKSGNDTELIEYSLNKQHSIKYIFDNHNTKSSIEINLESSQDEIFRKISKGHKASIKKSQKLGITVDEIKNDDELRSFIELYTKMIKVRKIEGDVLPSNFIPGIYNYLIKNNKGQILIAKDKNNNILGGAVLVYQGISIRYYMGASDPLRRDIPILHQVIFEAILKAKRENFKYFDFWGYNHFADEHDQVFNINLFKKSFGGYFTFFAKKMHINLVPKGYYIYSTFSSAKKIFERNLSIHKN